MSQRTQLERNRAVYRDPDYRTEAAQVIADNPTCTICGKAPSTEADHVPPLALHHHEKGSGCCILRASCKPCNGAGGQRVRNHLAQQRNRARTEGVRAAMIRRAALTLDSRLDSRLPPPNATSSPSFLEGASSSTAALLVGAGLVLAGRRGNAA